MPAAALETIDVRRRFAVRQGAFRKPRWIDAVDGVSLRIPRGETLGLVGESGCGKSTLAKLVLGLDRPTQGEVMIAGVPTGTLPPLERARRIQPVFQDPYSSLNPRRSVAAIIGMPLAVHHTGSAADRASQVRRMMDLVGLSPRLADQRPGRLSGGQRQRVAIARALILRPEIVVCDEPTSSLDVSVQAQILNLLLELQAELRLTYLIISHNLAVIAHMSDRVAVMYLGRIVEESGVEALLGGGRHPYTRALIASALAPTPGAGIPDIGLGAAFPDPMAPPPGCRFHPRCPEAMARCSAQAPRPIRIASGSVECHLFDAPGDLR